MITPYTDKPTAPLKGVEILIMDALSADEAVSNVVCPSPGIKNHTITITTSASVTGAIQLETSNNPTYTGAWSPLGGGPYDLATITSVHEQQFMFSNITFAALRARITTVVGGGTVSVSYLGN